MRAGSYHGGMSIYLSLDDLFGVHGFDVDFGDGVGDDAGLSDLSGKRSRRMLAATLSAVDKSLLDAVASGSMDRLRQAIADWLKSATLGRVTTANWAEVADYFRRPDMQAFATELWGKIASGQFQNPSSQPPANWNNPPFKIIDNPGTATVASAPAPTGYGIPLPGSAPVQQAPQQTAQRDAWRARRQAQQEQYAQQQAAQQAQQQAMYQQQAAQQAQQQAMQPPPCPAGMVPQQVPLPSHPAGFGWTCAPAQPAYQAPTPAPAYGPPAGTAQGGLQPPGPDEYAGMTEEEGGGQQPAAPAPLPPPPPARSPLVLPVVLGLGALGVWYFWFRKPAKTPRP